MQRHLAAVPNLQIVHDVVTIIFLGSGRNSTQSTAGLMHASGNDDDRLKHPAQVLSVREANTFAPSQPVHILLCLGIQLCKAASQRGAMVQTGLSEA